MLLGEVSRVLGRGFLPTRFCYRMGCTERTCISIDGRPSAISAGSDFVPMCSVIFRRGPLLSCFSRLVTFRYSDLNQSANGNIKSGPSGSGAGIVTAMLMSLATFIVVLKAVSFFL